MCYKLKRIEWDQILPEKVMHNNVNNIVVKTKFWFHKDNGNFGKMVWQRLKSLNNQFV